MGTGVTHTGSRLTTNYNAARTFNDRIWWSNAYTIISHTSGWHTANQHSGSARTNDRATHMGNWSRNSWRLHRTGV